MKVCGTAMPESNNAGLKDESGCIQGAGHKGPHISKLGDCSFTIWEIDNLCDDKTESLPCSCIRSRSINTEEAINRGVA
jgi:hypothetical protein